MRTAPVEKYLERLAQAATNAGRDQRLQCGDIVVVDTGYLPHPMKGKVGRVMAIERRPCRPMGCNLSRGEPNDRH